MDTKFSCPHAGVCGSGGSAAAAPCGSCCKGGENGCGSCSRPLELTLTETELCLLREFAQLAFLPVACSTEEQPVYLEAIHEFSTTPAGYNENPTEFISRCLLALKIKGLIRIDYDLPLQGYDYTPYQPWPIHGSMALTALGQQVLDSIS